MKVNILDAAMCALMVFLLCGRIGIYGYGVTIYVSEAVNASLSLARLCRKVGQVLPPSAIAKPAFGAIAATVAVNLMPAEAGLLSLIFRGCVFCGVYLLVIIVRALPDRISVRRTGTAFLHRKRNT